MVASFRKKCFKFWCFSLPPFVHMVGGKVGCTFATVKCLLLVVIWQFFLCGFNFSCSWRHCIQISQIRVWSARNHATSDNWVLPIIKCTPVCCETWHCTLPLHRTMNEGRPKTPTLFVSLHFHVVFVLILMSLAVILLHHIHNGGCVLPRYEILIN